MKYLEGLVKFYNEIANFGHLWNTGKISHSHTNIQNLEEIIIPYFDLKINVYHAFKLLGKLFTFNKEKGDFILIVYDYGKKLILESVLITLSGSQALIQEVIPDPISENLNLEEQTSLMFQSVRNFIQNKYSVQINRIKIINPQVFEKLKMMENEKENVHEMTGFQKMVLLLLDSCKNNLISAYPQLPYISTINRMVEILPDYHHFVENLCNFMKSLLTPITLFDEDWYVTVNRDGKNSTSKVRIQKPFEFGRITIMDHFQWVNFVKEFNIRYSKQYHQKPSYFVDINWCINFLSDVCESEFPISRLRFEFLLQRFLYFVKQNEELWDVVPRPIVYNGYVRLIIRLCGFHINPRKLSYWSIPSNVIQFLRTNFSSSSCNAILLTEKGHISDGFVCRLKGDSITEISYLPVDLLGTSVNNKKEFYNILISRFGFIHSLIHFDKDILNKILRFLIIDRNTKNPLKLISGLSLIRKLNNTECFDWYPPQPEYIIFKKIGAIRYFRFLNKILYDFLEF